jgi:hypothetical protein
MRYLKKYESSDEKYIRNQCSILGIKNYTINNDMSIDVNGNVFIMREQVKYLPLVFRDVRTSFHFIESNLTSLIGSPRYVGSNFNIRDNSLTNLRYSPISVGGFFS